MIFVVILCLAVGGAVGDDECDGVSPYQKCRHHLPMEAIVGIKVVPDKEELLSICPGELKYFRCFTDHLDDCGGMNEHYAVVNFMENSYEIAKDLCNENSELHKTYTASAECYKSLEGTGDNCENKAKEFYEDYFETLRLENPDNIEAIERSSHRMCMIQSFRIACISEKVMNECGEIADSAMMEIISKSQYIRQFCSQSLIDELQTTFLEKLDLDQEDNDIYKYTFNVIRK